MKTFQTTKCRAYPHDKLNISKGVIRSRELALVTGEEIASALGKHGVTNIRRISNRKGEERIQTNNYILTFNQPHSPKEVKIGYCLERIEQHVPAPLRCFKCQKYGHHRDAFRGRQICTKCGEKDPDRVEENCFKQIRFAKCWRDHPAYIRFCDVCKKEKKKIWWDKSNMSFQEARKIVGTYMGENSYASVARRADTTNQDKYRILGEINPVGSECFRSAWKTTLGRILPSTSSATDSERSYVVVQTKTHVGSTTPTRTIPKSAKSSTKQPLH